MRCVNEDKVLDSSAYDNHAEIIESPEIVGGLVGDQALDFDQTDELDTGTDKSIVPSEKITISFWLRPNDLDLDSSQYPTDRGATWRLHVDRSWTDRWYFYVWNRADQDWERIAIDKPTVSGEKVFVTVTYDGASDIGQWWIDGTKIRETTLGHGKNTLINNPKNSHRIADGLVGEIEDFRIYNRILSQEEIELLYNKRSRLQQSQNLRKGLVGHWTMNEKQVDNEKFRDRSAQDNHAEFIDSPTATSDSPVGAAYEFDGDGDKAEVLKNPVYPSDEITVVGWVKTENLDDQGEFGYAAMIDHNSVMGSGGGAEGWGVGFRNDGMRVDHGDGETAESISISSFDYHRWYFYWFTHDANAGESRAEMWPIDDINDKVTGSTNEVDVNIQINDYDLEIGRERAETLPGEIAEIRLYNRVLSKRELKRLYKRRIS